MKITIKNCYECPCYYVVDFIHHCKHPGESDFDWVDSPYSTPSWCPLRTDPELIIEIKDDVLDPRITCALDILLKDQKLSEDWLDCPNPEFDGIAPRKLIKMGRSETVAEYLEDVLLGHPH